MRSYKEILNNYKDNKNIFLEDLFDAIGQAGNKHEDEDLDKIVEIAMMDDSYDEIISLPALVMLPFWKEKGIDHIIKRAFFGKRKSFSLCVVANIAMGITPKSNYISGLREEMDKYICYELDEEIIKYTRRNIRKAILQLFNDDFQKNKFFHDIAIIGMMSEEHSNITSFYYNLLFDKYLLINEIIINNFETLLNKEKIIEEEIQVFLTNNPIILDPFTIELRIKHQLGDDLITDYISRRSNNEYILIEIESTTDKLFNKNGQFSSALNEAVSQVRDFQTWISDNINYAEKKLPNIRRPEGLVIIGRNRNFNDFDRRRLAEENFSRKGHIKIMTYDDLLEQAKNVFSNIISKPIILKARDQKII